MLHSRRLSTIGRRHRTCFIRRRLLQMPLPLLMKLMSQTGGGNAFVLKLSKEQAERLGEGFSFDPAAKRDNRPEVFMSQQGEFQIMLERTVTSSDDWAAKDVIPTSIPITKVDSPVLYVVDSGVEPLVGTGTTHSWHTQWTAGGVVRVKLLQGQTTVQNKSWPKVYSAVPSNTPPEPWSGTASYPANGTVAGGLLNFTASTLHPCPPIKDSSGVVAAAYDTDPQRDAFGHGTRIASTAVGTVVGLLSNVIDSSTGSRVEVGVQSIRVFSIPASSSNNIISTTSTAVEKGISKAVTAHRARVTANGGAPVRSVLLFAARSTGTPAFIPTIEAQLYWAWWNGMIVVVAGGNDHNPVAGTTSMYSPTPMWYNSSGQIATPQSPTPSRFDWQKAQAEGTTGRWPAFPTGVANPSSIPMPGQQQKEYLIMVGGHAKTETGGSYDWSQTSSIGPGIDILAPCEGIPSMDPGGLGDTPTLTGISGTSMSAGFVAGVALAYLSVKQTITASEPDSFRAWLLPSSGPTNAPACTASAANAKPGSPYLMTGSNYQGIVPRLRMTAVP